MIEWFRHDTDARNDIKIRKLLRDNDRAALGAYWMCIEIIYQNEGYADEAAVTEELSFYDMDEFIPAMIALDLIERAEGGKLTSKRVLSELEMNRKKAEERSEKARNAVNSRWHKNDSESNGIQTNTDEYERIRTDTKHTTLHNTTQHNKDCNSSSPLQEESNKNNRNNNYTGTTPIACSEPSSELMLEAENPIEKPVFITIIAKSGKEVPIYRDLVDMWKDAFRAVDVEGQLREMKAWSISHESERKTEKGMIRFINNWLSREQDKAGRPNGNSERNDFYGGKYIKGTDIKMDLFAKGADRSRYTNQPALEDLL